ncbi:MAG: hypothetical protein GY827_04010 [Cytophagales bacterium]|nr:hypothetical protein [Cytophagales bacterium]
MLKPITPENTANNLKRKQSKYVEFDVKDGILYATYINKTELDLVAAKEIVSSRLQFQQGKTYPTIVFGDNLLNASKEARDYFAQQGEDGMSGIGVVVTSLITRVLVNFYLQVSKPNVPTKFFDTEEEALKWVVQFKK